MAKTIKFNLICDGKPIRTLEDLRQNFSIEDILSYHQNNLLHRWLLVRGYEEELQKVQNIKPNDSLELVKELINIFEIETDSALVEEYTYILQYQKEREFLIEEYKKGDFNVSAIVDDYHAGYRELIDTIVDNKNDIAKIKAAIKEIDFKYPSLYQLDFRNLFYTFLEFAPMAIFVMLMNETMRKKYLPIYREDKNGKAVVDTEDYSLTYDSDKNLMFDEICKLVTYRKLQEVLGENLKEYSGATDSYWKDVEASGKTYMILSIQSGNYVRNAGVTGEELNVSDINNSFQMLNGIDYKSNNRNHQLLYMEV